VRVCHRDVRHLDFRGLLECLDSSLRLISTAAAMSVATNTHTSSHYATSARRWVNEFLTFFGYPLFLGLSACHWWRQHVVLHHPAPNVIGTDNDVDLEPWFARTRDEVERSTGLRRIYYEKLQWLVFPFAVAFIGFNMQASGWRALVAGLRGAGRSRQHWIDLSAMLLHYVVWLAIPMGSRSRGGILCAASRADGLRDVRRACAR